MKILSKNYKNQNLNLDIFIDFSDEETICLNATKTANAFGKGYCLKLTLKQKE